MQLGVKCPRGTISWDECLLHCAHDPLHPCDYTADILDLMRVDYEDPDREPGVESFTPTRLLGCPRQPVLMSGADYYVDVEQAYPATRGNMVHALMEKARYPGAIKVIREHRFATSIMTKYGPQPFTAKPDLIVVQDIVAGESIKGKNLPTLQEIKDSYPTIHIKIVDYKSTADIGHDMLSAKLEHQLQVNMYAWVVFWCLPEFMEMPNANVVIDSVEIVYCSMKKIRRFTSAGERTTKGKRLSVRPLKYDTLTLEPIKLWKTASIGKYVARRVETYLDAKEVEMPDMLEGDDAWLCNYCPVANYCREVGNVRH